MGFIIIIKQAAIVGGVGARSSLVIVCAFHGSVDGQFAGLHDFAADDHLVEDLVHFVEVEDEVQFAHAAKVLI